MPPCGQPGLPIPEPLRGAEAGTYTHTSIVERLPEIGRRTLAENDFRPPVVARLEQLLAEIPAGPIRLLRDGRAPDAAAWTGYLAPYLGQDWLRPPWFLVETYFYRRILEATGFFDPDGPGRGRDPFASQKRQSLAAAGEAIRGLGRLADGPVEDRAAELVRLLRLSLWGNQADLSMWPGGEGGPDRHGDARQQAAHTLADDAAAVAQFLVARPAPADRVDVLLDNVGAELLADLGVVAFLLDAGLAAEIVLWVKAQPTFVSDATAADLHQTLSFLAAGDQTGAAAVAARLASHLARGRLRLQEHLFWNSPLPGWEMPADLCAELGRAALVVSKGDANYRRLLGDRHWAHAAPFDAIAGYVPAPLVAVRTLKSELAAGIAPERAAVAAAADPDWLISGRWGVIQFVKPEENL